MTEIEIGPNLVAIFSLIINGILIPLLVGYHKKCKKLENNKEGTE
jgi:hypothetical protein